MSPGSSFFGAKATAAGTNGVADSSGGVGMACFRGGTSLAGGA